MVIPIDLLSLRHVLGVGWLFILEDLQNAVLTVKQDIYDFTRLKFIEQIRVSKGNIFITLSTALTMNYLVDYLIPFTELKHTELSRNKGVVEHVVRYLSSMLALPDNGIFLETILQRLGVELCPLDQREIWIHFKNHKDEYKRKGIELSMGSSKFIFNEENYISFDKSKIALKGIKKQIRVLGNSGEQGYINFNEVKLSKELQSYAKDIGVKKEEIERLFQMFKNKYMASDKSYKNLELLWKRYVNGQQTNEIKIANKGKAVNIEYNNEMIAISNEHKLDKSDAVDLFKRFKNNYTSKNAIRSNWIPLWENYILTHKEFSKNNTTNKKAKKSVLEENFYFARLVSSEIKNMLSREDVSIADVVSGDVEVTDIGFATYPVPPGLGKGEETLFFFKDKRIQEETISKYTQERISIDSTVTEERLG
jgi:hypothetical protein